MKKRREEIFDMKELQAIIEDGENPVSDKRVNEVVQDELERIKQRDRNQSKEKKS